MADKRGRAGFYSWAALAGIVSAGVFLAVAELLALLLARGGEGPLLAVGSFVIDIVPRPLKEFAITTFGEFDKIALLVGLGLAVLIAAAIAGVAELVRPALGAALLAIAGALCVAAVATRAGATTASWVASLAGAALGVALLAILGRQLRGWRRAAGASTELTSHDAASGVARRRFLVIGGISAIAAIVVGVGSRVAGATTSSISAIRRAVRLPTPRSAVPIPAGAEFDIPELSPLFTPNAEFYRVDTALTVPSIDPATWRLNITGMVDTPTEVSFDELIDMGLEEFSVTLTCVSNEVGGDLVGTAKWWGVPVRKLLAAAGPNSGADMVLSRSIDGFTASTPLESLTDENLDAILAVGMNGEPLPLEHGFPVRMVVPGLYGYVSATKWLTELRVTTFADDEAYWTPRGYSATAPIKMSSRIDTPRPGRAVPAGRTAIAGVAWAQTVGIDRVEISIDDGEWQRANLSNPVNRDTWVQWYVDWDATPGTHYVMVRAVNARGEIQLEERAPIAPDGSSGWQRMLVSVTEG